MAELDGSIYFRQRTPDVFGAIKEGVEFGEMVGQRRKQRAIDDAYAQGMTTNPDGTVSVDSGKTVSALAKVGAGKEAMDFQEKALAQNAAQDKLKRERQMQNIDLISRVAPTIKDQTSYEAALNHLGQSGVDISQMPRAYDPGLVNRYASMALSAKDRFDNEFRERELISKSLDRKEARDERRFQAGIKIDEKRDQRIERDMQKLSKDISGTQEMLGALDEVEAKLGSPIENFKRDDSGNLSLDGKPVDLPGVSIPGLGRKTFYSNKARELNDAAARVFNATLKDRSGSAVTDPELARLRQEFSEGKYNTEAELVDALQRYKRQTQVVLKNREAAYNPDVVDRYTEQGGRTSRTIGSQEKTKGKTIVKTQTNQKTGEQRIVYSDGSTEIVSKVAGGR